jgi:hypothetical protein
MHLRDWRYHKPWRLSRLPVPPHWARLPADGDRIDLCAEPALVCEPTGDRHIIPSPSARSSRLHDRTAAFPYDNVPRQRADPGRSTRQGEQESEPVRHTERLVQRHKISILLGCRIASGPEDERISAGLATLLQARARGSAVTMSSRDLLGERVATVGRTGVGLRQTSKGPCQQARAAGHGPGC